MLKFNECKCIVPCFVDGKSQFTQIWSKNSIKLLKKEQLNMSNSNSYKLTDQLIESIFNPAIDRVRMRALLAEQSELPEGLRAADIEANLRLQRLCSMDSIFPPRKLGRDRRPKRLFVFDVTVPGDSSKSKFSLLIDNGATWNHISMNTALKLGAVLKLDEPISVTIADGSKI